MTLKYIRIKICRGILFLVKVLFAIFILTTFIAIGPIVEGKLYPVVSPTSNAIVTTDNRFMYVSFSGTKNRICDIKNISVLSKVNGNFVQAKIKFLEMGQESDTPVPRPTGLQYFGPWKIEPIGSELIITSQHQCHYFWNTESQLVNWKSK